MSEREPLDVDVLAVKYGPAKSEGGRVTITVTQWQRLLRDLSREQRRTAALMRVSGRILDGLGRLMSRINDGETRDGVQRMRGELHQALTVVEESREDHGG